MRGRVREGTRKLPFSPSSEDFEHGVFTLNTHQMFSVYTVPEEFENATITGHFNLVPSVLSLPPSREDPGNEVAVILDLCLRKARSEKSRDYRHVIVFQNCSVHRKTKAGVFKFLQFEERFRKAAFGRPNRRNKAAFFKFLRHKVGFSLHEQNLVITHCICFTSVIKSWILSAPAEETAIDVSFG